jgi:DNA-3-methyladenine glycosylase
VSDPATKERPISLGSGLGRGFFDRSFLTVASELIGTTLLWQGCGGRIVEVEAYGIEDDAACHTATRKSSRIFCQENPPGTAYVYLNYGIHWMLNVLARDGILLIRALEPQHGIAAMQERRRQQSLRALCSGPGKLGQALGLTGADHGHDLTENIFYPVSTAGVVTGRRIGISKAVDLPWRFLEQESPWVSVPLPREASPSS